MPANALFAAPPSFDTVRCAHVCSANRLDLIALTWKRDNDDDDGKGNMRDASDPGQGNL